MSARLPRLPIWLVLLPLGCGLPVPRVVEHPVLGRAIRLVEEKTPGLMVFSKEGDLLLIGSGPSGHDDGEAVRVFDTRSLELLWSAPVARASFDPEGKRVLVRADDHTIEIREARSGRPMRRFKAEAASSAAFVGPRLIGVGVEGGIVFIDAESGSPVDRFSRPGHHDLTATSDGRRLLIGFHGEKSSTHQQIVDYPGFAPRCAAPMGDLGPDGNTLAITTLDDTLVVDANTCAPRLRTCGLAAGPSVDGKVWFRLDGETEVRRGLLALHLPEGRWQLGPSLVPPPDQIAAGPTQLALQRNATEQTFARYFYLRPLSTWLSRDTAPAGESPQPYRWLPCPGSKKEPGDEPPGSVAGGTFEDRHVALRLLPGRIDDLVLQVTNRHSRALRIEWARSSLVVIRAGSPSAPKRLWLGHLGCARYDAGVGDRPCAATEILPGSGYVDVLRARARPDDARLFRLAPRCGDRIALELAVSSPGEAPRTLRAELRYCSGEPR